MKKVALITLITTFIICGWFGIIIVIFDLWNEVTAKFYLSAVTLMGFSLPGLACSFGIEKSKNKILPTAGLIVSIIGALYILLLIWGIISFDLFNGLMWQFMFTTIILSGSLSHISLLQLINTSNKAINIIKWATIAVSLVLDVLILLSLYNIFEANYKTFEIVIILESVGTIVTPLMYMISGKEKGKEKDYKQLEQLKGLLDSGAITQEEYNKEKEKLLNK